MCSGINLAELIDKLEVIEALTLVGMTEPCSTSHRRGSDTIERLSLYYDGALLNVAPTRQ
jgi:hypothetical protein